MRYQLALVERPRLGVLPGGSLVRGGAAEPPGVHVPHALVRQTHKPRDALLVLDAQRRDIIKKAEADAVTELAKAQEALDKAVAAVQKRDDLKDEEKLRILATVQESQSQAFSNKQEEIDKRKNRKIQDEERKMEEAMKSHRRQVVVMAVIVPPLLPLFIGLVVFFKRRSREMNNVSKKRIKKAL